MYKILANTIKLNKYLIKYLPFFTDCFWQSCFPLCRQTTDTDRLDLSQCQVSERDSRKCSAATIE